MMNIGAAVQGLVGQLERSRNNLGRQLKMPWSRRAGAPAPVVDKLVLQRAFATPPRLMERLSPESLSRVMDEPDLWRHVTPAQWRRLLAELRDLPDEQLASLGKEWRKKGLTVTVHRDVNMVTLFSADATVRGVVGESGLRVTLKGMASVYEGGEVVETIRPGPGQTLAVRRGDDVQYWNPGTGYGKRNGQPIEPRWAEDVPGEAVRKPWQTVPVNRFVPPSTDNMLDPAVQRRYDNAVRATGAEVRAPFHVTFENTMDRYNCHSFALTDTRGDLGDPFIGNTQPRWVSFPGYQLANGPYARLRPHQRVHVGDIVLYQRGEKPTHTGIVRAVDSDGNPTRVESKWGAYGLYLHDPMDVPPTYGGIAGYFRPDARVT